MSQVWDTSIRGGDVGPAVTGWLLAGLIWVLLGMVWMPSGPSLNPGHAYNLLVALMLYLPFLLQSLWLGRAGWIGLLQSPTLRTSLGLMAWAAVSACWSNAAHRGQEAGRALSVLALLGAWQYCFSRRPARAMDALRLGGGLLAGSALLLILMAWLDGRGVHRLAAVGVLGNANSAGSVMGAGCLWLALAGQDRHRWWHRAAIAGLLLFMLLSQSRAALAGLLVVIVLSWIEHHGRRMSWLVYGSLGGAAGLGGLAVYLVGQRGLSLRPQIAEQALDMVGEAPWYGLGEGSRFLIHAGQQTLTHTHNLVTQTTLQLGLPGLLLLLALVLTAARSCLQWRQQPLARMAMYTGVYALVVTQFDVPGLLESPHPSWILLWIPVANVILLERGAVAGSTEARLERSVHARPEPPGKHRSMSSDLGGAQ